MVSVQTQSTDILFQREVEVNMTVELGKSLITHILATPHFIPVLYIIICTVVTAPYREVFSLLFTPLTGNQLTVNVTAEDDQLVEDNDVLSVLLSTDDSSVDVPNPLANVTFIDDDSKLHLSWLLDSYNDNSSLRLLIFYAKAATLVCQYYSYVKEAHLPCISK